MDLRMFGKKLFGGMGLVCASMLVMALPVFADEPVTGATILQSAGVASILEPVDKSAEDYIAIAEEAEGAFYGYTNIGICTVANGNLNVRKEPSTSGKLVGKLPRNAACEVISEEDGWAYMKSGEVEGYVSMEFLATGAQARLQAKELARTVALANVDGLRVREQPNTDCGVVTQVLKGEELEYVATLEDGWIQVAIDGEDAYVSEEFIDIKDSLDTAITMQELLYGQGVSELRVDICEYAKQFVGNPYVWGGTSLTKGADCSGFTMSVFKHFGIKLSHSSRAQAGEGKKISASDLRPGDLVFYGGGSGSINHVALYIGNGQVVHASSPSTGIRISKYNYRSAVKCVRVIKD